MKVKEHRNSITENILLATANEEQKVLGDIGGEEELSALWGNLSCRQTWSVHHLTAISDYFHTIMVPRPTLVLILKAPADILTSFMFTLLVTVQLWCDLDAVKMANYSQGRRPKLDHTGSGWSEERGGRNWFLSSFIKTQGSLERLREIVWWYE